MRITLLHRPTRPLRAALGSTIAGAALLALVASGMSTGVTTAGAPAGGLVETSAVTAKKRAGANPVTPGDFAGFGFDQCLAPTQRTMNTWLQHSPFLAVGIYISGDSRACRSQPNLTPTWVSTQLRKGWKLLPITLGPQASCQPRFPRYSDDFTISPKRGNGSYTRARKMGQNSAISSVADAKALGITPGSTLWYDLEGFDTSNTDCRESALSFLSAWVTKVRSLGYVTGVYSSAGSGIAALDSARVNRPNAFNLPQKVWVARWDGVANTSTSYMREDGWRPGGRIKQYRGGHDETWGGARINIDSNYLDMGRGTFARRESHCGGVPINFLQYQRLGASSQSVPQVKALQCLLTEKGAYDGPIDGSYSPRLVASVRAWKGARGFKPAASFFPRDWMNLHAYGARPVLKRGSSGAYVRRIQRALAASGVVGKVRANGTFGTATDAIVRNYQKKVGLAASGVVNKATWAKLGRGARRG